MNINTNCLIQFVREPGRACEARQSQERNMRYLTCLNCKFFLLLVVERRVESIEGLSMKAFKQQFHHQESQFMDIQCIDIYKTNNLLAQPPLPL